MQRILTINISKAKEEHAGGKRIFWKNVIFLKGKGKSVKND